MVPSFEPVCLVGPLGIVCSLTQPVMVLGIHLFLSLSFSFSIIEYQLGVAKVKVELEVRAWHIEF